MKLIRQIALLSVLLLPLLLLAQDKGFLKKYAGTYHMLADGEKNPPTPDKYVFTQDGKCEWTSTFKNGEGKMEVKKTPGTWSASEGFIQMKFDMGDGEGSELLSDFYLKEGVFHSKEKVYLKKVVTAAAPKAKPKS